MGMGGIYKSLAVQKASFFPTVKLYEPRGILFGEGLLPLRSDINTSGKTEECVDAGSISTFGNFIGNQGSLPFHIADTVANEQVNQEKVLPQLLFFVIQMKNFLQLQREAERILLNHLKEKYPESQCSFFKNLKKLETYTVSFKTEVLGNCVNLKKKKRKAEYLDLLKRQFRTLEYNFDKGLLDKELKNYGEDFTSFPEVSNPELKYILSIDPSKIWSANKSQEEISEILEHVKLIRSCVLLAYEIKIKEILYFLKGEAKTKKEDSGKVVSVKPVCKRDAEKKFLKVLKKELKYFDTVTKDLENPGKLSSELAALIKRTKKCKLRILDEIDDNLLLLKLDNSVFYLKRLKNVFGERYEELEQFEFDLLNKEEENSLEPEQQISLKGRDDILEALKDLNAQRLAMIKRLLKKIDNRLENYPNATGGLRSGGKREITTKKLAHLYEKFKYLPLDELDNISDTTVSWFLSMVSGLNEKNLYTALREVATPGKRSKQSLENEQWAEAVFNEVLRRTRGFG